MSKKCRVALLGLVLICLLISSVTTANTTINVWTGFPELEPFYKWVGEEYSKSHPGVTI